MLSTEHESLSRLEDGTQLSAELRLVVIRRSAAPWKSIRFPGPHSAESVRLTSCRETEPAPKRFLKQVLTLRSVRGKQMHTAISCPVNRQLLIPLIFVNFLFFLLVLTPAQADASGKDKGTLYAVIVGLKKFQDTRVPPLSISDKDATDFYKFLKDREQYFSKAHVTLLTNEQATRANVSKALRQDLRKAGKDDFVIIYLSGHGAADPALPNEFYFVTYDAQIDNLFASAVMMNDQNLFKGIDTDRVLLVADACHSGGFSAGLQRVIAKETDRFFSLFKSVQGRVSMLSSKPDEKSYEEPRYGNSVFTHFLLKGLRGEANKGKKDGIVTAKELYDYVYDKTKETTQGLQHPQLYCAKGHEETAVFRTPSFAQDLKIKAEFFYEDQSKQVRQLKEGTTLKSGDHVGIAFRSESDCYVYILWWDSSGAVGRLFPNPQLTEGTGEVKAGKTYWLPSQEGERWYVLDDKPGQETVYFLASRNRNPKIESLYDTLSRIASGAAGEAKTKEVSGELERELNLMGFADVTAPKTGQQTSFQNRESFFHALESQTRVVGADAIIKLTFNHVAR